MNEAQLPSASREGAFAAARRVGGHLHAKHAIKCGRMYLYATYEGCAVTVVRSENCFRQLESFTCVKVETRAFLWIAQYFAVFRSKREIFCSLQP